MTIIDHTDRIQTYAKEFEVEFEKLWEKKHCKWFFPKTRRAKLRRKLFACKRQELFDLVEQAISEILPEKIEESLSFFTDIKSVGKGE